MPVSHDNAENNNPLDRATSTNDILRARKEHKLAKILTETSNEIGKLDEGFKSTCSQVLDRQAGVASQTAIGLIKGKMIRFTLTMEPADSLVPLEPRGLEAAGPERLREAGEESDTLGDSQPPPRSDPVWVGYTSLGVGIVGVLLLLLLVTSPPKPQTSTDLQKEIAGLSEQVRSGRTIKLPDSFAQEVADKVKVPEATGPTTDSIKTAIKEAFSKGDSKLLDLFAQAVADKVKVPEAVGPSIDSIKAAIKEALSRGDLKVPDSLAQAVASKVKVPESKVPTLEAITAAVKEAFSKGDSKLLDSFAQAVASKLKVPESKAPTLEAITAAVKEAFSKAIPVEEFRDVYVVITHGAALDANAYSDGLRDSLTNVVSREKDALVRVGLVVAATDRLDIKVSLDAPQVKFTSFGDAAGEDREAPQLFGRKLKSAFDPGRPKQRAVLVVTAGCTPLLPDQEGWKEIPEVHVVILARGELGPADRERLAKWHTFAESRNGSVHLIGNNTDVRRQNASLFAYLKQLIRLPQ